MKRIPTIIGLTLVVALVSGLAVTTQLVKRATNLFTKADVGSVPTSIGIANVTDTSFTVYWVTPKSSVGTVNYGKDPGLGDGVAVDEGKQLTHFVRVTNLKPATKYYYRISSTETSQPPSEVMTAANQKVAADPVYGKILEESGAPATDVIVVLSLSGSDNVAELSKVDGSFVLPVGERQNGAAEKITFLSGGSTAEMSCKAGQDRPLPEIKLGETSDCGGNKSISQPGFKVPSGREASVGGELRVDLKESETVSTPLPTISGKAGPNQTVNIVVHSDVPYSGTVKADSLGNWSWTPPANLSPGQHTATITITNPDGTTQTVTRNFFVSSGTPILPITSGTPSATPTHKACVNQSCQEISGAGADSCLIDADCAPPPLPPPIPEPPKPEPIVQPPPTTPPATGAWENTLGLLVIGAGSLFAGLLLFL